MLGSALLLTLLLAPGLPDRTSVVATTDGVFVVEAFEPAALVATPAALGVSALGQPSITWIPRTDLFILTSRDDGSGASRVWRLLVEDTGPAAIVDLTPTVTLTPPPRFVDAEYSVGLDALFLLDEESGRLLAWPAPATTLADVLVPWAEVMPLKGRAVAVNGARLPFGLVVIERVGGTALVTRLDEAGGVEVIDDDADWHETTANPITGQFYLASETTDIVGELFPGGGGFDLVQDFNVWNLCLHPAQRPVDVCWDPLDRQIVILAQDGILPCLGFGAAGDNHVVRMPIASGGPPAQSPLLLTFEGFSLITGTQGALALVRHDAPDVTWLGLPGTTGAGTSVALGNGGGYTGEPTLGGEMSTVVTGAPPDAGGFMVFGFVPLAAMLQGQVFVPMPQIVVPTASDAAGEASFPLAFPASLPGLVGLPIYSQWWFDDTTTPAAGDLVGSNGGVYTAGT